MSRGSPQPKKIVSGMKQKCIDVAVQPMPPTGCKRCRGNTKTAILEQRRIQKINEIQELKIQFQTSQNSLALIRREIATIEPLVKSGLAPETRLIALQRDEEARK